MDPARAPIFVLGTGRSGTTLLRFMLCAHPRIYITHEASFYVWESLYPRHAPRREFLEYYFQTGSFRWLRLDPGRVLAGLPDPLPPERVRDAFAAVMREKAADYGRVRFGDKTPAHAGWLKRIFRDFPDARVVHIVRDPRGTSLSLSRMPWGSRSRWWNAAYCELEWREVQKWRDRMLHIRLEDLLADPRQTMGRVLDYVGEPWDDAVLDHPRHIPDRKDMPPLPWLESAAQAPGAPAAQWETMSPLDIRLVESVARRLMKEAGYEPARVAREPRRTALWWESVKQIPETLSYLGTWWHLTRQMRDPRNFDTEKTNALMHRLNPRSWAHFPGFDRLPKPPALPRGRALPAPRQPDAA
jgi:hypothetical protein